MFGLEFVDRLRVQVQGLEFLGLVAQQFQLGGWPRPVALQRLQGLAGAIQARAGLAYRDPFRLVVAEVVEQLALHVGAQQQLVLVLAVNVQQLLAELAQQRDRHRAAVDGGAAASLGGDRAPQDALGLLVGVLQIPFARPFQCPRAAAEVEFGAEFGPVAAVAHPLGVAAVAEQAADRVDQDRLAGAGLAGQHGHAGSEFQFQ